MAIKITNLQKISEEYSAKSYIYSDLHLDFQKGGQYSEEIRQKLETNDTRVDYDESAIRNSLRNLFNTRPGQRFLFPNYGLDLYQFLFEPLSESIGQMIGEKIVKSIELYEPRVKIQKCRVECLIDDNQYDITLIVEIPIFNTIASINSQLDIRTQSFIFVETNRNN